MYNIEPEMIPKSLHKGGRLKANTIGELIGILELLPGNLQIKQGFGEGVAVAIYNIPTTPELEFVEVEDCDFET